MFFNLILAVEALNFSRLNTPNSRDCQSLDQKCKVQFCVMYRRNILNIKTWMEDKLMGQQRCIL